MRELEIILALAQLGLLAVIAAVDIRELRIHTSALAAFVCVSGAGLLTTGYPALLSALVGAAFGGGLFGLVYAGGRVFARVAKLPADTLVFGRGDAYLMAACGLAVGFPGALAVMLSAVVFGGVTALVYVAHARRSGGYRRFTALPYAQNIAAATAIALLLAT